MTKFIVTIRHEDMTGVRRYYDADPTPAAKASVSQSGALLLFDADNRLIRGFNASEWVSFRREE